jgi:hypothetical protein
MPSKKHCVELTSDQRERLLEWIGRGERPAGEQRRVRVLLKADEGPEGPAWTDARIAGAFGLSSGGVADIRERFCHRGLMGTVKRKKSRPRVRHEAWRRGGGEADPVGLLGSPRKAAQSGAFAFWPTGWWPSFGVVVSLSFETVRRTLKITDTSRIGSDNGCFLRSKMPDL